MKKHPKIQNMQKTIFTALAIFLLAASIFTLLFYQKKETLTGYAVSNIFFRTQDGVSTLGFVARDANEIDNSGYNLESAIIMPSGKFTAEGYTVTIPYLGVDVIASPPPEPDIPSASGRGSQEDELIRGEACEGSWQCSDYGECQPSNLQYRVCVVVSCEYTTKINIPPKPSEVRGCEYQMPEEPEEPPTPPEAEKFEFYVKPKIEKKYKPGDQIILHTYINNPSVNGMGNLEVEYNIDEGAERTVYVEYEGVFDVQRQSKYNKYISHSLTGYENKKYRVHTILYSNGKRIADSYYDLDLS